MSCNRFFEFFLCCWCYYLIHDELNYHLETKFGARQRLTAAPSLHGTPSALLQGWQRTAPPPGWHPPYGQQAGSMYPTGMLSCLPPSSVYYDTSGSFEHNKIGL